MIATLSTHSRIFNAIYRANEDMDSEYKQSLEWITDIVENTGRGKGNKCEICSSTEKLEQHHVRGRKHGNECITACLECHKALTDKQRLWDKSWLNPDSQYRDSFLILGLINVCELKWDKTGHEIYRKIADNLTEGFQYE